MKALFPVLLLISLGGCATDPSSWTQADWDAYNQIVNRGHLSASQMAQQTQTTLNQASQAPTPQASSYEQPNSTAIVYCRDLTGSIVACKQIR